ncbi:MAG: TM0106 family RecB-like putative nuclease [Candidatus Obscuribacterales bacterium]|nr:TM0106 family RecB-like putative nuclease [Candidatus Obscuribacterales bacterium]
MQKQSEQLIFSPSDLIRFMESEFVTWMNRYHLEFPGTYQPDEDDATSKILQNLGLDHERAFVDQLKSQGREVVDVSSESDKFAATLTAMQEGKEVVYQAALRDQNFAGYADFLIKVPGESSLGNYHYEPWDTKLALKSKPYFLIQLACYADMLRLAQDHLPRNVHVVLGDKRVHSLRTEDYLYFYRQLRQALLHQQQNFDSNNPPDFIGLEEFGRWTTHAKELMEKKDHLCRVANIRTVQIKKLYAVGINTMTDIAQSRLSTIPKMQEPIFATLKQQARLQIESKGLPKPKFEIVQPQTKGFGLTLLPPTSPLDVYFDMEGYPLTEGGLEYLFGATIINNGKPEFIDWWAHTGEEEKLAFETFIDWLYKRWQKDPLMHVYHYASYEKTALRKLMGKYGTKENEVDALLRNEVFVDLYTVVRQSLKVGEPSYSIKNIERLYKEKREGDVATALDSVVFYQRWLDERDGNDWQTSEILRQIRNYNNDDCDSTWQLAEWLRVLQHEHGIRWQAKELKEAKDTKSAQARAAATELALKMLEDIPVDPNKKTENMRIRELLAHLLEFHWREAKPVFWAKYDRHEMTEEELFDDPGCLAGLVRTDTARRQVARSYLYDYRFDPNQDTKIDSEDSCFYAHDLEESITVAEIDVDKGRVSLKRATHLAAPPNKLSLIKNEYVDATAIAQSICQTANAFLKGKELPSALNDFLCRRRPRISGLESGALIQPEQDLTSGAVDIISKLQNSYLCIQGPPGSGKTYTAAKAIVELLKQGKRVGVTSNSHKAIAKLMDDVATEADECKITLRAAKLQSDNDNFHVESNKIQPLKPKDFFESHTRSITLVGGTAWAFSDTRAVGLLDYLFVDEAGQVSLANLVGVAPSARNLILIGDQMQLSQPLQGTHPGESGQSILDYLLQGKQIIPDDLGIFLGVTRRLHPDVCKFISGAIYEDRLKPFADTEQRVVKLPASSNGPALKPSGILYVPVVHEGNSQDSEEEAAAIVQIVQELLKCSFADGETIKPVDLNHILIVAPYNMQVRRLKTCIPGAKVGSVDKFQGQEAPIVIVSMCSSTGDASPRGLEFIFSKNRLNVAISRAKSLAIVVGSPALARTHCNRIEQIELVNLFCRIVNHA